MDQASDHFLSIGAAALRKAALNEAAKEYLLSNEPLYLALRKAADRYIGGETLQETLAKVEVEINRGFKCSIEFMGESTREPSEAKAATQEFVRIARAIRTCKLNATISLDLSHIGLAISDDLAAENLSIICQEALPEIEVTISAEGVERTDAVHKCYADSSLRFPNLSITLQAYLHRTKEDFQYLVRYPGRIRVVKGAFETPPGHSLPRGSELNNAYLGYIAALMEQRHPCSIATHDPDLQRVTTQLIADHRPAPEEYEFESLYGIGTKQLVELKDTGHPAKLYFVYGREWYLYLCNRIAEYPLSIFQALDDMVG